MATCSTQQSQSQLPPGPEATLEDIERYIQTPYNNPRFTSTCDLLSTTFGPDTILGRGTQVYKSQDDIDIVDDGRGKATMMQAIFKHMRAAFMKGEAVTPDKVFVRVRTYEEGVSPGKRNETRSSGRGTRVRSEWLNLDDILSGRHRLSRTAHVCGLRLANAGRTHRVHTRMLFEDIWVHTAFVPEDKTVSCWWDAVKAGYYLAAAGWAHTDVNVSTLVTIEKDGEHIGKLLDFGYAYKRPEDGD